MTVYHQDHCSQSLYMPGHSPKHYFYTDPLIREIITLRLRACAMVNGFYQITRNSSPSIISDGCFENAVLHNCEYAEIVIPSAVVQRTASIFQQLTLKQNQNRINSEWKS